MASQNGYLVIYKNTLKPNLKVGPEKLASILFAKTEQFRPLVEGHAKMKAPWTDRTGNARQTLSARTFHSPVVHKINLSHGMHYGIWLEVKNHGKYAVIIPTIKFMGKRLMNGIEGILEDI